MHHRHLKLMETTGVLTPDFRKDEILNSIHFWVNVQSVGVCKSLQSKRLLPRIKSVIVSKLLNRKENTTCFRVSALNQLVGATVS